jgi:putative zinc finger protein
MRCDHEHDDGAYVLGALSPTERTAYERHLATCSFCREAVRDMSALPDLLAQLDAREFARLVKSETPRTLETGMAPAPRCRNSRVRVGNLAAAALLVAAIAAGVVFWTRDGAPLAPPPGPAVAMTSIDGAAPVSATVRLAGTPGGTKVDLVCVYSRAASGPWTFRLIAYGPDGDQEQIGSWLARPGTEFALPAATHFARGALSRLELVRYDGKVLLAYDVP